MDALTNKPVRTTQGVRDALLYMRQITAKTASGDNYYRLDRHNAAEYFWDRDDWEELIRRYFDELHQEGERVVYVDVCGRAEASLLGADKNYSFSLQPADRWFKRNENDVRVCGDLFSAKDFYSFVNLLRQNGDCPAWVTCEPVAGLQSHTPCEGRGPLLHLEVVYQRLENNLRKILEVVRPGGFVFLECPFQGMNMGDWFKKKPVEEYEASLWVKDFAKKNKCSVRIKNSIVGPRYLLRKRGRRKLQIQAAPR